MSVQYIAIFIFGLLIGNFATTVLYRLPLGITLHGFNKQFSKPPFCSTCNHPLKFYEYLPVFGWFSTLGKCNYCGEKIPYQYTLLELFTALLAVSCFYIFGIVSDKFILIFSFGVNCLLCIFTYHNSKLTLKSLTTSLIILGAIYRTLIDQTINSWLLSLAFACIFILLSLKNNKFNDNNRQEAGHILLPASIWLNGVWLFYYSVILLCLYAKRYILPDNFSVYKIAIALLFFAVLFNA